MPKSKAKRRRKAEPKPTERLLTIHRKKDGSMSVRLVESGAPVISFEASDSVRRSFGHLPEQLGKIMPMISSFLPGASSLVMPDGTSVSVAPRAPEPTPQQSPVDAVLTQNYMDLSHLTNQMTADNRAWLSGKFVELMAEMDEKIKAQKPDPTKFAAAPTGPVGRASKPKGKKLPASKARTKPYRKTKSKGPQPAAAIPAPQST